MPDLLFDAQAMKGFLQAGMPDSCFVLVSPMYAGPPPCFLCSVVSSAVSGSYCWVCNFGKTVSGLNLSRLEAETYLFLMCSLC